MLGETAIRQEARPLPVGELALDAELALLMQPEAAVDLLEELLLRPAWHSRAACRGMGTEVFFPTDQITLNRARRICSGCPVNAECAEFALDHPSLKGIWAGMSERRRARARKDAVNTDREREVGDGRDAGGIHRRKGGGASRLGRG